MAFAEAGFLFLHLDKSGHEAEAKRHNEALEQLAKENQVELLRELIQSRNYASSLVTRTLTSTIRTTLLISFERYVRKSEDVLTTL